MDNIELFIEEALSWKGTKWRHGQALKGNSTDCIQWLLTLGKKFDWIPLLYQAPKYHRDWALHNNTSILKQEVQKFFYEVDSGNKMRGDILLFVFGKTSSHAGIYLGNNKMIHAHIKNGVEEVNLSQIVNDDKQTYEDILDSVWRPINV